MGFLALKIINNFYFVYLILIKSWFLKKATGKNKFTGFPGHVVLDTVSIKHIYEIAKIKKEMDLDLKHVELKSICSVNNLKKNY
jgi:large subunit ribosomal protein L11